MRMLACCGLDCASCPALVATATDDESLRAATAAEWSAAFGVALRPSDIVCEGCMTDGLKFSHCLECEVRLCGLGRGLPTCAPCPEYDGCPTIAAFHGMVPQAKEALDALRK